MGFNELPEFPQGGVARAESGNQGIPPEAFQQALLDQGIRLIADTKRPEDTPAVQAVLGAEVDTLLGQLGHAPQPASAPQTNQPPGYPDTASTSAPSTEAARSPRPVGELSVEQIRRVMEKYSDPTELAKAYLHTDQARTRAQQDRAVELSALRSTVEALQGEIQGLRGVAENYRAPAAATTPEEPEMSPEQAEQFWKNPAPKIERIVNQAMTNHLMAYTDAQAQYQREASFEQYRATKAGEIEALRPFMDQVYMEDRQLYESLDQRVALDNLLKRARERQDAIRGNAFYDEMRTLYGMGGTQQPGIPAQAAPGTTGALPSPGTGVSRLQQTQNPPGGNWSNTRNMEKLWKSRSDSVDEMGALTAILKERGFGEDVPIY